MVSKAILGAAPVIELSLDRSPSSFPELTTADFINNTAGFMAAVDVLGAERALAKSPALGHLQYGSGALDLGNDAPRLRRACLRGLPQREDGADGLLGGLIGRIQRTFGKAASGRPFLLATTRATFLIVDGWRQGKQPYLNNNQ